MRAAVVNEDHRFDIVEVPDPSPGPGELLLQVAACGICGSDLKAVANMPAGLVMGHEFAGTVVATGRDTAGWREGTAVCALPLIGCGVCVACVNGDVAHCPTVDMVGVGGSSGGYSEFVRVSARESFALPEGVGTDLGALVEPLAVGLHAVERAQITPKDRVLVIGAGPVGLAVTLWARHFGARELVVSDPVAARRQAAAGFGATHTVDPTTGELGAPYDLVFECVGTVGMIAHAVGEAGLYGRVIVAGVCTKPDPFVPIVALMKELAMHFVVYYRRRDYAYVVDMLAQGRIDVAPFVTDRVTLDAFPAAFEALKTPSTQCKVLVQP
jgi:(R,R)-butanediol dehydrogenase/meso-butanediol dehydrogenase/diacetyl reductase